MVEKILGGHVKFCTACSDRILTKIVFLSRLLPMVSFDVVSYGAGLTKMSLSLFSNATFLGMLPLTFLYNYFGPVITFHRGWSLTCGLLMVFLFFGLPLFLEKKNWLAPHHEIKKQRSGQDLRDIDLFFMKRSNSPQMPGFRVVSFPWEYTAGTET